MLSERTEGWIAALQLAVLSVQGHTDASGFIARFAGGHRFVVDYLVEEVLRHQTGPVREFPMGSAVLARLTGPLCDAVTGRDDGSTMLVALGRPSQARRLYDGALERAAAHGGPVARAI